MIIGVPTEVIPGERRVALVPTEVRKLVDQGLDLRVQSGAGAQGGYAAAAYEAAGARLETDVARLYESADLLLKVRPPTEHAETGQHEVDMLREGSALGSANLGACWAG